MIFSVKFSQIFDKPDDIILISTLHAGILNYIILPDISSTCVCAHNCTGSHFIP